MKKAVVTGGAGFIGSHLVEKLAEGGYEVIILDDLSTGKLANISPLLKDNGVNFQEGSVTDPPLLQKLFHEADYVFHLAAVTSVPGSIAMPQATHEVNATGTLSVLLAARDNGVRKVVYASSAAVYGDTPVLPQKEDMLPNPQSPYAAAKLGGEYYCRVFSQLYSLPTVCLRYFNVYGPRQDPASQYAAAIPRFISVIAAGGNPVIYGEGNQTRDFIFVKDVARANLMAAESEAGGVYNIAGGHSISINELAQLIIRLMGAKARPTYEEPREGDILHSLADITGAGGFGYQAEYTLEEGLQQTIKYQE